MASLSVTHHSSRTDPSLTPAPLARALTGKPKAAPPILQVTTPPPAPNTPRVRGLGEGKDDRCPRLRENQRPGLQIWGRIPAPALAGDTWHLLPAGRPRPHTGSVAARMQPRGWNGTEGASTPPLSPRFPNDRGGKFTSWDGAAFCRVHLTPRGRRASRRSPPRPAQPPRRVHLHLETREPDVGHLRRHVRPGTWPLPGVWELPAAAGAVLTSGGGASSRTPYWAVPLPRARGIQAAAGDTLPGLCCIPLRGRASRRACTSVCWCECVSVCTSVCARAGRGCADHRAPSAPIARSASASAPSQRRRSRGVQVSGSRVCLMKGRSERLAGRGRRGRERR